MTTTDKLLYTPVEAAHTLGVSRSTLYVLLATGQIGSVKVGSLRRIPATALHTFIDQLAPAANESNRHADGPVPSPSHPYGTLGVTSERPALIGRPRSLDSAPKRPNDPWD